MANLINKKFLKELNKIFVSLDYLHPDVNSLIIDYLKPKPGGLVWRFTFPHEISDCLGNFIVSISIDNDFIYIILVKKWFDSAKSWYESEIKIFNSNDFSFKKTWKDEKNNCANELLIDDKYIISKNNENSILQFFDKTGVFVKEVALQIPIHMRRIAQDNEFIYIVDPFELRIKKFNKNNYSTDFFSVGSEDDENGILYDIAVDDKYIYLTNLKINYIKIFDKNGKFINKYMINCPIFTWANKEWRISVDNKYIYVSENKLNYVQVIDKFNGKMVRDFENDGNPYYFKRPLCVVSDDYYMYVASAKDVTVFMK